jgi:2-oxoglutarate ferredoxin oxidoreductase subunit beta
MGSVDHPFDPISVALGAEAAFVARTHDMDRAHMQSTIRRAFEHHGASVVEIYQNCNVFNDAAFEDLTAKDRRAEMLINLAHGEPVLFGTDGQFGVFRNADGSVSTGLVTDANRSDVIVHDEGRRDPTSAFELGDQMRHQLVSAQEQKGQGDLAKLFRSNGSWNVE